MKNNSRYKQIRIGETQIDLRGELMTIIGYEDCRNVTIQYEDGTVREHVHYSKFKTGEMTRKGTRARGGRIGETAYNNCNFKMEIVGYNTASDITVKFDDDTIVSGVNYYNFKKGSIPKPGSPRSDSEMYNRLGETTLNVNGERMTIIAYRTCMDITVQFDNGNIREHVTYKNFKSGTINSVPRVKKKPRINTIAEKRIGESYTNFQGLKATCIEYTSASDIKIKFEDGTVKTCRYAEFKNGLVSHDNRINKKAKPKIPRIGETSLSREGLTIEIIDYTNTNNITVQFKDGEVKYRQSYYKFKRGQIGKTRVNDIAKVRALDMKVINLQGDEMVIADYNSAYDITVKFSDGTIKEHQTMAKFKTGRIEK